MSITAPRELKVLVERVVRPLPIPLERQKRLRAEFLEHLQAVYAEELARDDDSDAAIARTGTRFGDPTALSQELRGTVHWWERWKSRAQLVIGQRAEESVTHYVWRVMRWYVVIVFGLMGMLILCDTVFGRESVSWLKVNVCAASVMSMAIWSGGFLWFGLEAGVEWDRSPRRWARLAACSIGQMASWFAAVGVLMLPAGGFSSDWTPVLLRWSLAIPLIIVGGLVVGVQHRRETLYRREWAEVNIDAAG